MISSDMYIFYFFNLAHWGHVQTLESLEQRAFRFKTKQTPKRLSLIDNSCYGDSKLLVKS